MVAGIEFNVEYHFNKGHVGPNRLQDLSFCILYFEIVSDFKVNRRIMAVSFTTRLRATDSVLIQEIQGEIMFLNMASETYFGLDPIGSRMFRVLNSAESIQSAYTTLLQEFDVDGDRLRADLDELVTKLLEDGLIKIDDA